MFRRPRPARGRTPLRTVALLALAVAATGLSVAAPPAPVAAAVPSTDFHPHFQFPSLDTTTFPFGGGPLEPGVERRVVAAGFNTNVAVARRMALRLTTFDATGFGVLRVHPCGAYDPLAPAALRVRTSEATGLAWTDLVGGIVCVTSTVRTDLRVHIEGYEEASVPGGLAFVATPPATVLDRVVLTPGTVTTIPFANRFGVAADASVVSLLLEAEGDGESAVRTRPCDRNANDIPAVRHPAGVREVSGAVGVLAATGDLCVSVTAPTTVRMEVNGYWSATAAPSAEGPVRHLVETARAGFVAEPPRRLLDTRRTGGPVAGGTVRQLDLRSLRPDDATDVVMNVTVTEPAADGFLTVYPCSAERPVASNLNFTTGQTVPNLVTVSLGTPEVVCLYANVTTQVVADLSGWFVVGAGGGLVAGPPTRLFDTRSAGDPLPAGGTYELDLSGRVDAATTAVAMNVTVTGPAGPGYVTVYPCRSGRPTASNLNYVAGLTVPNLTMVDVGPDRRVCFYTSAPTHLLADLAGWFTAGSEIGYVGQVPLRLFDTRETGAVFAGRELPYPAPIAVPGLRYLPGVDALLLNVTAVGLGADGYVTAYPCRDGRPTASNLNVAGNAVVPNLVVARLDVDGRVCFYSQQTIHLLADAAGLFTAAPYTSDAYVR